MELFTTEDLDPFLNQWLKRPEMLEIIANWSFDEKLGQINLTLTQKTNSEILFDVPVEFEFHFTDGMDPILFEAKISTSKVNYEIPVKMKPKIIVADPKTVLLADIRVTEKR